MPLVGPEMKAKFQSTIHSGLKRVFSSASAGGTGYDPISDAQWAKMADAISDIAVDIVNEIQQNAQVVPGQQVVTNGSPSTQAGQTVSPGKIV